MSPPPPREIKLATSQVVPWAPAPGGMAQVEELRRRTVRLYYVCKSGKVRRPIVAPRLLRESYFLPLVNPMDRAVMPRSRSYAI